jgi:hypothetical protein
MRAVSERLIAQARSQRQVRTRKTG